MDVKKGCDVLDESWVEMKRFKEPYYWVAEITISAQIPGKRGLELDIGQNPLTLGFSIMSLISYLKVFICWNTSFK